MKYLMIAVGLLSLTGCATKYPCQEPGGISCQPVSEIYAKSNYNNKESQASMKKGKYSKKELKYSSTVEANQPVRTENKTIRIWFAPWVDNKDVFHDQSFVYLVVDRGRWLIEEERSRLINKYKAKKPRVKKPALAQVKKP